LKSKTWNESKFFGISNSGYMENQKDFLAMLPRVGGESYWISDATMVHLPLKLLK